MACTHELVAEKLVNGQIHVLLYRLEGDDRAEMVDGVIADRLWQAVQILMDETDTKGMEIGVREGDTETVTAPDCISLSEALEAYYNIW